MTVEGSCLCRGEEHRARGRGAARPSDAIPATRRAGTVLAGQPHGAADVQTRQPGQLDADDNLAGADGADPAASRNGVSRALTQL